LGGLRNEVQSKAVVAVKAEGNSYLDEERVAAIRNTVVAGVAGLNPENVTVTDLNGSRAYAGTMGETSSALPNSEYIIHKRFHEKEYRQRILDVLRDYPGVVVGVHVELDDSVVYQEFTRKYDPDTVAVSTQETTKTSSTKPAREHQAHGEPASGSANQAARVTATVKETRMDQQSVTNVTELERKRASLIPNRVTASIGIPRGYYVKLWHDRHYGADVQTAPEPDAAQLATIEQDVQQKIKSLVVNLLPRQQLAEDPFDLVTVVTNEELRPEAVPAPRLADTIAGWLAAHWQTVALVCFGVFGLIMLRGAIRNVASFGSARDESLSRAYTRGHDDARDETTVDPKSQHLPFGTTDSDLRNELTGLVKEDPQAAVNVLKSWIGDTG
jgi:flagellar biosynthesis/type III secretory pathway M-ring protein FliF/YscJ